MGNDVFAFTSKLEVWIVWYGFGLVFVFGIGLLALLATTVATQRRIRAALIGLEPLPKLNSALGRSHGATEPTYRSLLNLVESLADGSKDWWPAVEPNITTYFRQGDGRGRTPGYFVTERIEDSVLGSPVPSSGWSSFVHAIPGLLTSLGLLGTFIALLIGLNGLEANKDGTYELSHLISNLSGKFLTSIVALALSVLFVLLEIAARAGITRARQQLVSELSGILPFLSPSHVLLDMQRTGRRQSARLGALQQHGQSQNDTLRSLQAVAQQQASVLDKLHALNERQTTQLERFNTDLAISIGSAMDANIVPVLKSLLESTNELHKIQAGLGEELLKEVGTKISGAVSGAAGEEIKAVTVAIKEAATTLKGATDAMKEGQDKLVSATSAIIDQINNVFGENAKRLQDDTATAVRGVVEQIDSAAGGFSTKIGDAGNTVSAALLQTSENLRSIVAQCERIVTNTDASVQRFNTLVDTVSGATRDIAVAHAALRATSEPLGAVATKTALLIDSLNQQVTTIGVAAASLKATSENVQQVQTSLEASWRGHETRFAEVDTALDHSLTQMRGGFDFYAEKIASLNSGLDEHLGKALSDLSGVVGELHEILEDMQDGRK